MNKIFFELEVIDNYPPVSVESLWGVKLNEDEYQIKNLPFYINDIALDDTISVNHVNGQLFFKEILKTSGRGLLRIIILNKEIKETFINKLEEIKLNWESMKGQEFYSVDVGNLNDYIEIKKFLEENSDFIDYQETVLPDAD